MREVVAAIKHLQRDSRRRVAVLDGIPPTGWQPVGDTWKYASPTTFTITDDVTDSYCTGMFVKWTQSSTVKYGQITNVVYSAPNTTITIRGDTIANEAITEPYVSRAASPQGNIPGPHVVLIASAEITTSVASITFNNIPSGYVDLLITGVARTDRSVIADSVMLRFNGDTGNNYDRLKFNIQSTGYVTYVNRAASAIWFNRCEAAKATSQTFSPLWGFIPSYGNTSAYKYFVSGMTFTRATAGADTDLYLGYCGGCWRSTSAITSITLLPDVGTNFVSGCMFYLWG